MRKQHKQTLLAQIIYSIFFAVLSVSVLFSLYIRQITQEYRNQLIASAEHTLTLYARQLSDQMTMTEQLIVNDLQYNEHFLRMANKQKDDDYLTSANIFWQDLYHWVQIEHHGADAYFFQIPYNNYTNLATKISYNSQRAGLNNWVKEDMMQALNTNTWAILLIGNEEWLVSRYRSSNIIVGGLFNLQSVKNTILEQQELPDCLVEFGRSQDEMREGYLRLDQELDHCRYHITLWIPEDSIRDQLPPVLPRVYTLLLLTLLCGLIISLIIRKSMLRPIHRLGHAMEELECGNADFRLTDTAENQEAELLYTRFNQMADSITDLKIQVYEEQLEKMDIESTNLRLQVNPHFILNSLNIIFSLARGNNVQNLDTIRSFTKYLANYLRFTLWHTGGKITLDQELKCISDYLDIQKVRFPDAFSYIYDVAEEVKEALLPSLLILNFVENSIKYALAPDRSIEIYVLALRREDKLCISVCDTGNGMEEDTLTVINNGEILTNDTGKHIGIWNCRRRIELTYPGQSYFRITSSDGEGTQVYLEIPWEEQL